MKRTLLFLTIVILFGATSSWCSADTFFKKYHTYDFAAQSNSEEYKSMCELHPKECAKGSLGKLGETLEQSDGNKYRVIAEAKSTNRPVWIQFIDYCPIGEKLDGKCNFVVFFVLKEDGFYGETFSCGEAIAIIIAQCKTEGIKYDDYVHKAGKE